MMKQNQSDTHDRMRFYLASVSRCEVLFARFPALVLEDHPCRGERHLVVGALFSDGPGKIKDKSRRSVLATNELLSNTV